MSSLYRKYRPDKFAQLLGQEHIISSIEGMLKADQVGHAYLFSGPRGTGKTTLARLLARAINCVGRKNNAEACGVCEICLDFQNGQSVDVMEIDAASNRGIDDIRELREKITFAPTRSKYRVYIIDEVHMLSREAFNALLKTLEEPPAHAIFILATTELHKVPDTIISRCLRYQFHRAQPDKIVTILQDIALKEGLKLNYDAAQIIAQRAEGSYRDALTLLSNVSGEKDLTVEKIRTLIGLPSSEIVSQLLSSIESGQAEMVARLLKSFVEEGLDVAVLVRSMANVCRERIFSLNEDNVAVTAPLLEELLVSLAKARHSVDATSLLCASLISAALKRTGTPIMATNTAPVTVEASGGKITDLTEKEMPVSLPVDTVNAIHDGMKSLRGSRAVIPPTIPISTNESGAFWPNFLSAVHNKNHALYAIVSSARLDNLTDDKLVIAVKFRFYSERLFEPKNRNLIEAIATEIAGHKLILECIVKPDLNLGTNKEEDLLSTVVEVFEINE